MSFEEAERKAKEYWEGFTQATYESVKAGYGDAHPSRELDFYVSSQRVLAEYKDVYDQVNDEWFYAWDNIELDTILEPLVLETWMMNLIAQLQAPPDIIDSSERYVI